MRSIIKRDQVQVDESAAPRTQAPRADQAPPARAAKVRLLQLDAETQAIEFTCPCGEVSLIEIQCEKKS